MSRSTVLLVAALALVAVVARYFLVTESDKGPLRERPPGAEDVADAPHVGAASTAAPKADRVGAPAPVSDIVREPMVVTPEQAEKARAVAATLREKARFPPTSRPIADNVNPIVESRAVQERMSPPGQGRAPTLIVFASSYSYEAPNPIILFAKFIRQWPDDRSERRDAEIAGELVNSNNEMVAEFDLRDDGQERDIEAGDGIFTTRLTPAAEDIARWNGLITVRVWGETGDGDKRSAKTRFYYGAPSARLTGNYQDQLVDGNLQILAELDVKALGEYRIDATLDGAKGLIAWAQGTAALEPGIVWMPITFWGLVLRQANEPGPYRLSSIALANVTLKPPQLNDAIGTQYETAPYKPGDFGDAPFNDPKLLQKADRYDARARGESPRVP